jgi:Flp pilus assembly protein TadD
MMRRQFFVTQVQRLIFQFAAGTCLILSGVAGSVAATSPPPGQPAATSANFNADFERCRAQANLDACYDAIRWRPSDPSLLSALGDALVRANRPADALRTYRRVASLAPNLPGVVAKITAIEATISAKRAPVNAPMRSASAAAEPGKRYSNAAPETQSH